MNKELFKYAVELFPRNAARKRAVGLTGMTAVEILSIVNELSRNKNIAGSAECDETVELFFADFQTAAGRQLSGNHRMTAIQLIDLNDEIQSRFRHSLIKIMKARISAFDDLEMSLLSRIKQQNSSLRAKGSTSKFWSQISSLMLDIFAKPEPETIIDHKKIDLEKDALMVKKHFRQFNASLNSFFEQQMGVFHALAGSSFVTEKHVLFITKADLNLSGIALSFDQIKLLENGEPIFLSPLRLYTDQLNKQGRQPLSAGESVIQDVIGQYAYLMRNFLAGAINADLDVDQDQRAQAAREADDIISTLLHESLVKSSVRKHQRDVNRPTESLLDEYLKRGIPRLRMLSELEVDNSNLKMGALMKKIGRRFIRQNADQADLEHHAPLFVKLRGQFDYACLLLKRASELRTAIETIPNSSKYFEKPVPMYSREIFAESPDELLEALLIQTEDNDLDFYTSFAMTSGVNPARFWPSAWPLIFHFDIAITIAKARRLGPAKFNPSIDEIAGLAGLIEHGAPKNTILERSRSRLRDLVPAFVKEQYYDGRTVIQLDEKQKLELEQWVLRQRNLGNKLQNRI